MLKPPYYCSFYRETGAAESGLGPDGPEGVVFAFEGPGARGADVPAWPLGGRFAVSEQCHYRLECAAHGAGMALLGVEYFGADGVALTADNYDLVTASEPGMATVNYFRPPPGAATARLVQHAPDGGEFAIHKIRIAPVVGADAADWAQRVLSRLSPLPLHDGKTLARLPRLAARLNRGGQLSIVLLGDSIMNDLYNGLFGAMLTSRLESVAVRVAPLVVSCGGCVRFQHDGTVQRLTPAHQPDLVVIGGISHDYDLAAIRGVIDQVRMAGGAEVLALNGAVCQEEWCRARLLRDCPSPLEAAARTRTFNAGFASLAGIDGVAIIDARASWDGWLASSGLAPALLMRDAIHANRVGKLLFAALVAAHFTAPADCTGAAG